MIIVKHNNLRKATQMLDEMGQKWVYSNGVLKTK